MSLLKQMSLIICRMC